MPPDVSQSAPKKRKGFDPSMIPVILGFLLLVGVLGWVFFGRSMGISDEALTVASRVAELKPGQFEPVDGQAGDLGDWFLLHGFEKFSIPARFVDARATGAKILKSGDDQVGVLYLPDHEIFLFLFDPARLGIDLPPAGKWQVDRLDENHSVGLQDARGMAAMVILKSGPAELTRLLQGAK